MHISKDGSSVTVSFLGAVCFFFWALPDNTEGHPLWKEIPSPTVEKPRMHGISRMGGLFYQLALG